MVSLFRHIVGFLNNMDGKAWISLLVSLLLLGFVVLMLFYGEDWLGLNENKVQELMSRIADSPMAIIGVISVFSLLALTGFPQTFLIAGTVAVFGPQTGALYSWVATMSSATLTFALGNVFGGGVVGKLSAGRASRMIGTFQRHGVLSTMMIRWIPSAPFIVINAIAGMARISIFKYWLGTGIGIIPKILFIAAFTGQAAQLTNFLKSSRDPKDLVMIVGIIIGWFAFLLFVRWLYIKLRRRDLNLNGD
ncbi:MAG: TVP38/TMEM64 family protein [bacterium]